MVKFQQFALNINITATKCQTRDRDLTWSVIFHLFVQNHMCVSASCLRGSLKTVWLVSNYIPRNIKIVIVSTVYASECFLQNTKFLTNIKTISTVRTVSLPINKKIVQIIHYISSITNMRGRDKFLKQCATYWLTPSLV